MKKNLLKRHNLSIATCIVALALLTGGCEGQNKPKDNADAAGDTTKKQQPAVVTTEPTIDTSIYTIGAITKSADGKNTEIIFNESARIFTIANSDTANNQGFVELKNSLNAKSPVKIISDIKTSTIRSIEATNDAEKNDFMAVKKVNTLAKPLPLMRVDLSKIDTHKFNIASKSVAAVACTSPLPDYAAAKAIFDFCAKQNCSGGSPTVVPCIPFQYVGDGCYARAHKMCRIIDSAYHYCTQKVFSFGPNPSTLAVVASKWGGCCVRWWYHVAPLVAVKTPAGVQQYVIDPGMFNEPVLLSTWLQAQQNTKCATNARVTSYSIQPWTAYSPTYPTGAPYSTDPNFINTNATLIKYKTWKTCN